MSDDVKRYMICGGGAHESPRGTWVTAYDYDRLRAEIKKKDRALLAAKYDAERVEYYRNTLCVDNGKWDCLPKTGAAASVIDPEKLGNVLDERDRLRAELAEAKAKLVFCADGGKNFTRITDDQINAAWERGKKQPDQNVNGYYEGLWSLGIVPCSRCGGTKLLGWNGFWTPNYEKCDCPNNGWVIQPEVSDE